jgi:hypothetical protein
MGYRARVTGRSKRRAALTLGLALALGLGWASWIASAPNVARTCEHVLELARLGGEEPAEAEVVQCLEVMQHRREAAGWSGWAKLSRCIGRTHSLDEAGRCKAR